MRILISFLFIFSLCNSIAQIQFRRVSVSDGLSQSTVNTLFVDQKGLLWVGTLDGLNRYDGTTFEVFRPSKKAGSINSERIHSIHQFDPNELFIGTRKGISTYNTLTGEFNNYPVSTDSPFEIFYDFIQIEKLRENEFLALGANGLYHLSRNGEDMSFNRLAISDEYSINEIARINDSIWLTTEEGLLLANSDLQVEQIFQSEKPFGALLYDQKGRVWVSSVNEIIRFEEFGIPEKTYLLPESGGDTKIKKFAEDIFGNIWMVGGFVWRIENNNTIEIFKSGSSEYSLSSNITESLTTHYDGSVFIGTSSQGFNIYNPKSVLFNNFSEVLPNGQKLSSSNIVHFHFDKADEYWIASANGLNYINLTNGTSASYYVMEEGSRTTANRINIIEPKSEDRLWVGTTTGLYEFNKQTGVSIRSPYFNLPYDVLWLEVSDRNELIISTRQNGLFIVDLVTGMTRSYTPEANPLYNPGNYINMTLLTDTYLYGATNKGLFKIDRFDSSVTFINQQSAISEDQFSSNYIKSIHEDKEGQIWLCTWGGGLIHQVNDSTFINYTIEDGLSNNVLYGILEDKNNNFWLSTNNGLSQFNKESKNFKNFKETEGSLVEYNSGAFEIAPDGTFYFGGVDGYIHFDPSKINLEGSSPRTYIKGFFLPENQQTVLENTQNTVYTQFETDTLELPYSQNTVGILFSAIDYISNPLKIYSYKLEGKDNNYVGGENTDFVIYQDLSPGIYTFNVRSKSSFSSWDNAGDTITLIVKGPLWMNPWVQILAVAIGFAVILLIPYIRTRNLRGYNKRLEAEVDSRTQELQNKSHEIASKNDELSSQSESIREKNTLLEKQTRELTEIRNQLEEKVRVRTSQLEQINKELIEQNTSLEQFSYIIAHNLRAPIARFMGLVQLFQLSGEQAEKLNVIDLMDTTAKDLDSVVKDLSQILALKKNENEKSEWVNVNETISDVVHSLMNFSEKNQVEIRWNPGSEILLRGMKAYIHSIFYNLIHNGIKYRGEEERSYVEIELKETTKAIEVTVSDNGVGIDMKLAEKKMFMLYQRFNTTWDGKGLGLYLVKTQIELMNGDITVKSELGKGTTFQFTLPK